MSYVRVDIDIDDFLSSCDRHDIKSIIESLIEDGHLNEKAIMPKSNRNTTPGEEMHRENCIVLAGVYHQLSREESDYIDELARKYK